MNKKILFLLFPLVLVLSCTEKDNPELRIIPNSTQPTIPIYDQMLLNGDVLSVTDQIVSSNADGRVTTMTEYVEFDKSYHAVVKYCRDGVEYETGPETHCVSFQSLSSCYAFFDFPYTWTSIHSVIEREGTSSFVREWDENGRYVKMRFLRDGEPVKAESLNDFELEKYLYDENGYPRCSFCISEDNRVYVSTENTYSELDEKGNATKIHVVTLNGTLDIARTIVYR